MPQQYVDFAFVKEHASFERVLAHYNLKLTGAGAQRAVLCPFHRERKASCKVELERKIFHCFGCGTKGNILEFVATLDDIDLRAAAIKIAEVCDIDTAPPRQGGQRDRRADQQGKPAAAPKPARKSRAAPQEGAQAPTAGKSRSQRTARSEAAAAAPDAPTNPPLTFALKLDPEHPYLVDRGLSAELVAEFGLGFCSRGLMGGRICIPIHDEDGNLVAYAGRWPGDDVPDDQERYKLPAKFHKSRVLFNLHRVAAGEHVVLVEGYWSVFRLHALGVPVVGLMGWSVSPEQVALLRERGVRFVTLLLDGDDAGQAARERVLPDLSNAFFVSAPVLPDGEKPDTISEASLRELVVFP
jgi:DNA primase